MISANRVTRVLELICVLLFGFHAYTLTTHLVGLPKLDDWAMIVPLMAERWPNPEWLFQQYSEHRYVLFRLILWAGYQLGVRDWFVFQMLSFVAYGVLLVTMTWMVRRSFPRREYAAFLAAIPLLLLPIVWEAHLWALLISIHLSYLFFFVSAYLLLLRSDRGLWASLGALVAAGLSILADSNGVALFLALAVCAVVTEPKLSWRRAGVCAALVVLPLLYFVGYESVGGRPPPSLPYSEYFWRYFLKMTGMTLGFDREELWRGIASFAVVTAPLAFLARSARIDLRDRFVLCVSLSLLACMAAVAVSRGGFWPSQQGQIPNRYFEFCILLLPFVMLGYARVLSAAKAVCALALAVVLLIALRGYSGHRFSIYDNALKAHSLTVQCIHEKLNRGERALCPTYVERYVTPWGPEDYTAAMEAPARIGIRFGRTGLPRAR